MGKVYMFNPQPSAAFPPETIQITVNGTGPAYVIDGSLAQFDYTPSSTFGDRANPPSGNEFGVDNSFLVVEPGGVPVSYRLDLPVPPPETSDLILYIFRNRLILLQPDGIFLQGYAPISTATELETASRPCEPAAGAANGTVYVFNLFSETINPFSPNGGLAGTIAGWSSGGSGQAPIFTPAVLQVERVLNANEAAGKFYNGANKVFFNWPSGAYTFTMTLDGSAFPITQDLLLFVLKNQWILADTFGVERASGQVEEQ